MVNIYFFLDQLSYGYFRSKVKIDSDWSCPTFTVPKIQKLKFEDEEKTKLEIFKYPSHYKHHSLLEYRSALVFYFSTFGTISTYWFIKALRNKKIFGSLIFGFFTISSFIEASYSAERIKDVKSIILKDGKTLIIQTFQDGFINYEFDVSEVKTANKNIEEVLVLVDKERMKLKKPLFFIIEPSPGCIYNPYIFNIVIKDQRYLKYYV